jgi:hypothetical protein
VTLWITFPLWPALSQLYNRDGTSRVKLSYDHPRRERHASAVAEGDVVSELFFEYRDDDP